MKLMDQSYIIKHWLATLLVAPILLYVYDLVMMKATWGLGMCSLIVLFGAFFSIPTLIAYIFLFKLLAKQNVNSCTAKIILDGLVVLGIAITGTLIGGTLIATIVITFSAAAILASLLFRLNVYKK